MAQARNARPDDSSAVHPETLVKGCPFCVGNEHMTPPEVYRVGPGEKDGSGWLVRVVPNKFVITDIHEVFIHSPSHTESVHSLPLDQVARILSAYRDRYRAHQEDGQVLIFCNHGVHAGASLAHPHSQLVVVPKQINLDALSREPIHNVVEDNTYFVTYCPEFSQWPYETWIAPKDGGGKFGDVADAELLDLATVLQNVLKRVSGVYQSSPIISKDRKGEPFAFNYYIDHSDHWFVRIIPRFIHRAGFELGTGLNVNIVDPTEAAKELQNVTL